VGHSDRMPTRIARVCRPPHCWPGVASEPAPCRTGQAAGRRRRRPTATIGGRQRSSCLYRQARSEPKNGNDKSPPMLWLFETGKLLRLGVARVRKWRKLLVDQRSPIVAAGTAFAREARFTRAEMRSRDSAYSRSCHSGVPSAIRATTTRSFKTVPNASIQSGPIAHCGEMSRSRTRCTSQDWGSNVRQTTSQICQAGFGCARASLGPR
jgi:hypothetical protein